MEETQEPHVKGRAQRIPNGDVKGTPLFELLSIRITGNTFKEVDVVSKLPHVEIYGHILLIDDLDNEFIVFNRERNQAKTVFLDDTNDTSVILQNFELESPRCLPSKFWLVFNLRDRHRDIVIIDDWKFIDCTQMVNYDKIQQSVFDKQHPIRHFESRSHLVYVDYVIFRCALLACVSVVVENIVKDGSDGSNVVHAEVNGTIAATTVVSDMSCIKRVLFDKSHELDYGASTKLSVFAVPSYSLLEIQANVEVNGDQMIGAWNFETSDSHFLPSERKIVAENCCIRVLVQWGHAEMFLREYEISEWHDVQKAFSESYDDYFSDKRENSIEMSPEKSPRSRNPKRNQPIYIQPRLEYLWNIKWKVSDDPVELVEVFSISVSSYNADGLSLRLKGKIWAYDRSKKLYIFNGDKKGDILHSNGTVKLVSPRHCYTGSYFGMHLDLKDYEGREISYGYATYDFVKVSRWHNLRICSVVRGKHGFASLHYTIFSDAVQARLKFTLGPNIRPTALQVHGRIHTRYSNFRYVTDYQKKYYQSTLFEKGESEAVNLLVGGGEIPLSKSVVAVPMNASLIVLADVNVLFEGEHVATLQYQQTFKPEKSFKSKITCDEFQRSDFCLSVSVEWTYVLGI